MSAWNDFNDAEQQQSFDLIPKGTVAPVRMTIKPGGPDIAPEQVIAGHLASRFKVYVLGFMPGLAYIAGLLLGWRYVVFLARRPALWGGKAGPAQRYWQQLQHHDRRWC